MTDTNRGAIIAIHGVGTPKPGDVVTELGMLFPEVSYLRDDVVIAGTSFPRLRAQVQGSPDLLEMNWSDIKRPPKSLYGVIDWTIALSLALGRANLSWSGIRVRTGPIYAYFSEILLLWITYPVLLSFVHKNLATYALAVANGAIFAMAALTFWMVRSMTRAAEFSGKCAIGLMLVVAFTLWKWPYTDSLIERIAVRAYGLSQFVAAILITATALELSTLVVRKKLPATGASGRLAFAYLPLGMLSAVGSCVWAVCLNIVLRLGSRQNNPDWQDWQRIFIQNLGFDLQWVEWTMAGATFVIGCFAMMAVLNYRLTKPSKQGRAAHRAIWYMTLFAPLALSVPGAFMLLTSSYVHHPLKLKLSSSQDVLWIYSWSALRIIPWLISAVSGLAVLLDVLSDVVFYITDQNSKLSSYEECNGRLELLLSYGQSNYEWLHVVGHSQGSVIAYTTVKTFGFCVPHALTTMGSPLGPLYSKYLQWPVSNLPMNWQNLFRSGDYIGGPTEIRGIDDDIGDGGHTGYWSDRRIRERLGC